MMCQELSRSALAEKVKLWETRALLMYCAATGNRTPPRSGPQGWSHILNQVKCTIRVIIGHLTSWLPTALFDAGGHLACDSATCAVKCYGLPANPHSITNCCQRVCNILHCGVGLRTSIAIHHGRLAWWCPNPCIHGLTAIKLLYFQGVRCWAQGIEAVGTSGSMKGRRTLGAQTPVFIALRSCSCDLPVDLSQLHFVERRAEL